MAKTKKRSKWFILLYIVLALAILYGVLFLGNVIASHNLRTYIKSLDAVDYTGVSRIEPTLDKDTGYYTFTSDKDMKVMVITDIHVGGGLFTVQKDRKAVTEVMTMMQKEKPDFVILTGDNTYAVPYPVIHGGGTLNNGMAAKDIMCLFEQAGVYYTTVFGNHDTESIGYTGRQSLAELYMKKGGHYCFLQQDFTDTDNDMPSVTNQMVVLKNKDGSIRKALLLMDSNSYPNQSPLASLGQDYDVIHDAQVAWAKDSLSKLGNPKVLSFQHIPLGEFDTAYQELRQNNWKDTKDSKYVSGVWGDSFNEKWQTRVAYGGWAKEGTAAQQDKFFETLGPDGLGLLEGVFVGHDHTNNAVVTYKGVLLSYGNSEDNIAYDGLDKSGTQRGAVVILIHPDGTWTQTHKNAYTDYGCSTTEFGNIYLDHPYLQGDVDPAF